VLSKSKTISLYYENDQWVWEVNARYPFLRHLRKKVLQAVIPCGEEETGQEDHPDVSVNMQQNGVFFARL